MARGRTTVRSRRQRGDADAVDAQTGKKARIGFADRATKTRKKEPERGGAWAHVMRRLWMVERGAKKGCRWTQKRLTMQRGEK